MENVEVSYVLGHSAQELERLSAQARHFEPFTRQVFQTAGVVPGMRVLEALATLRFWWRTWSVTRAASSVQIGCPWPSRRHERAQLAWACAT